MSTILRTTDTEEVDIMLSVTVEVEFDLLPSFPATRETPAERGGKVIRRIYWGGVDITGAVSEDDYERIERSLNRE